MAEKHIKSRDRVRAKRKKQKAGRRKGQGKYIIFLVIFILFAWLGFKVIKSDFFSLSKITIEGNKHLTSKDLEKMSGVKNNSNMFSIKSQKVIDNIKSNNWIKEITLQKRYFSGELQITVEERTPLGLIVPNENEADFYLVDYDGFIIEKVSDISKYELPTILDLDLKSLAEGGKISTAAFKNMTKALDSLDPFIRKQIQEITIESVDTLRFYTGDGVEILFGRAEDLKKKNFVLLEILKGKDSGKIIFIDLRVITNPVVKKLGEE